MGAIWGGVEAGLQTRLLENPESKTHDGLDRVFLGQRSPSCQ